MNKELLNLYFKIESRLEKHLRAQKQMEQIEMFINRVRERMESEGQGLPRGRKMMDIFEKEVRPLSNIREVLKKEAGIPAWEQAAYEIILEVLSGVLGQDLQDIRQMKRAREMEEILDNVLK